jgi:CMP-N-acetylneuraminic acid synthetase
VEFLGIVAARGGSKGIIGKNLVDLGGKPLIGHTITAAKESSSIEEVFLSTDDDKILEYVKSLGIETDYRRPDQLATDEAGALGVVLDVLTYLKDKGITPKNFVYLQPTSPLRNSSHIDEAITQFKSSGANTLVSVNEMSEHPYECVNGKEGQWSMLAKPQDQELARRQDYNDNFYFINGAIYIANTEYFLSQNKFFEEGKSELYVMKQIYSVDIDRPIDLVKAQAYLDYLGSSETLGE